MFFKILLKSSLISLAFRLVSIGTSEINSKLCNLLYDYTDASVARNSCILTSPIFAGMPLYKNSVVPLINLFYFKVNSRFFSSIPDLLPLLIIVPSNSKQNRSHNLRFSSYKVILESVTTFSFCRLIEFITFMFRRCVSFSNYIGQFNFYSCFYTNNISP